MLVSEINAQVDEIPNYKNTFQSLLKFMSKNLFASCVFFKKKVEKHKSNFSLAE